MRILDYFAMALVSFIMLAGASLKLTGNEVALQSFIDLGLPSWFGTFIGCLLYTSPSPRDKRQSRMPSSA